MLSFLFYLYSISANANMGCLSFLELNQTPRDFWSIQERALTANEAPQNIASRMTQARTRASRLIFTPLSKTTLSLLDKQADVAAVERDDIGQTILAPLLYRVTQRSDQRLSQNHQAYPKMLHLLFGYRPQLFKTGYFETGPYGALILRTPRESEYTLAKNNALIKLTDIIVEIGFNYVNFRGETLDPEMIASGNSISRALPLGDNLLSEFFSSGLEGLSGSRLFMPNPTKRLPIVEFEVKVFREHLTGFMIALDTMIFNVNTF